jgi:hypothetical protein
MPLSAPNFDAWGAPGVRQARCYSSFASHATMLAPQQGCGCGFWATYDPRYYHHYMAYSTQLPDPDSRGCSNRWVPGTATQGSIKAFGRVILGTKGFRAEKVEIEALWGKGGKRAAEFYGVPWIPTKKEFLEAYPPPNVDELILERTNGPQHVI